MAYKYTATASPRRSLTRDKSRILIVGHTNAGKTSILQRVADTTQSPVVFQGNEAVRDCLLIPYQSDHILSRFNLVRPRMLVTLVLRFNYS